MIAATSVAAVRDVLLPVHIAAGGVAIVAGFVALSALKGAQLHKKSGMVFALAMIPMAVLGGILSGVQGGQGVAIGSILVVYFVLTALASVHAIPGWSRRTDVGFMVIVLAIGVISLAMGAQAVMSPTGRREGLPPFPFFMNGIIALVGAGGDWRMLRSAAPLQGGRRLARHLWRMLWAFWVATGSFFLGQAKVIPKPIRILPVLAMLALIPLLAMLYWLWRVRARRKLLGVAIAAIAERKAA